MTFLPQEIIAKKRDGLLLAPDEITAFIAGLTSGSVTDAQAAAFAMAVFFRDMSLDERVALTAAMRDSGTVLDWSHLDGPVADKHSTGGIGDNVSLMLAPILAACGVFVPMISGRGLGHSGGTLDKLDAIPGYLTNLDADTFRHTVAEVGCAIVGASRDLAPADRALYAIRDVTATVESIPLITASILSKKLAAGLQTLVLDVKCGSGAFMTSPEAARSLAESLVSVANGAGLPTTALITDMNEPLASCAGNAVEVANAIEFLSGARRDNRLEAVTLALCAEVLLLAGVQPTREAATHAAHEALTSGRAAERFARMVAALGGPADLLDRPDAYLPVAPVVREIKAPDGGTVTAIDTRAIGMAVVALGGGRSKPTDIVDPAVGFTALAGRGERLGPGSRLGFVHARDESAADAAAARLLSAYTVGEPGPDFAPYPLVLDRVG